MEKVLIKFLLDRLLLYLAYTILNLEKQKEDSSLQILELEKEIRSNILNISYSLEQEYIDDGIQAIFERAVKK